MHAHVRRTLRIAPLCHGPATAATAHLLVRRPLGRELRQARSVLPLLFLPLRQVLLALQGGHDVRLYVRVNDAHSAAGLQLLDLWAGGCRAPGQTGVRSGSG